MGALMENFGEQNPGVNVMHQDRDSSKATLEYYIDLGHADFQNINATRAPVLIIFNNLIKIT
jgi:hypothetical protein